MTLYKYTSKWVSWKTSFFVVILFIDFDGGFVTVEYRVRKCITAASEDTRTAYVQDGFESRVQQVIAELKESIDKVTDVRIAMIYRTTTVTLYGRLTKRMMFTTLPKNYPLVLTFEAVFECSGA